MTRIRPLLISITIVTALAAGGFAALEAARVDAAPRSVATTTSVAPGRATTARTPPAPGRPTPRTRAWHGDGAAYDD